MPILNDAAIQLAFESLATKSKNANYRSDPVGWAQDVLGIHLWSKQREILESLVTNKKTAVKSCHSVGKLEPLSSRVPTPTGMRIFGDLRVGDYVLDAFGQPTRITYITEDQYQDIYDVVFNDGTVVQAGLDHLWQVQDLTKRRRNVTDWRDHWDNTVTVDTRTIMNSLKTDGNQYRWRVPLAGALQNPHNDHLPVEPYLLGVWLGDGTRANGNLTGGDTKTFYAGLTDDMAVAQQEDRAPTYKSASLRAGLRELGLIGAPDKHIPHEYLWNTSESQRKALLAGLMDSDGFVGNSNGIDLTDGRLAKDVVRLLSSLGVKATVREGVAAYTKDGVQTVTGTRYRISFTTSWNPFRNRGHNWEAPKTSKHTLRTIVDVRLSETQQASRCITVDNPLSVYLTGERFVPTHNTFLSAVAVCWWVSTRQDAIVRSTAPTSYQVHELLWEEIRKMHSKGGLEGEVNQKDEWKKPVHGVIAMVGSGKKPSDTNIHSFHGVHRPEGVLTILDEGCGIAQSLFTAADAISTGRHDRVLVVGNPDDPNTPFGDIFLNVTEENKDIWNRITVSAFDTPNFTGEEVPDVIRENLIQPEWVDARAREWGVTSGRYKSKILGEFPDQSDNSFFKQSTLDVAYDTEIEEDPELPLILGVDIAGSGEDDSVIYGNRGGRVRKITSWSEGNALFTAKKIIDVAVEVGADEIRIDNGGFGKGVIDILLEDPRAVNFRIIRMMGGDQATDISAHRNKRAENYDYLRMQMDAGLIDLDRADEKVKDQLLAVIYELTERGSIKIESKADMRKRSQKSPDELDAVVYCVADLSYLDRAADSSLNHLDPRDYFSEMPQWAIIRW